MGPPAIFYTPHQDDESLGMAGAIVEHIEAGRPVFLVLLTDGKPSACKNYYRVARPAAGTAEGTTSI